MKTFNLLWERPAWGWFLLLPALALAVLLTAKKRGVRVRAGLLALRLAALLCVLCVLCGMRIQTTAAPVDLVLLADRSDSVRASQAAIDALTEEILSSAQGYGHAEVISFGADTASDAQAVSARASNLQAALAAASDAVPAGRKGHFLLLSDGLETEGDLMSQARKTADRGGARLDALWVEPAAQTPEIEISRVETPLSVSLGQSCEIVVECKANVSVKGTLRLLSGNSVEGEKKLSGPAGISTYRFKVTPTAGGTAVYRAELKPDQDTITENNRRDICLQVLTGEKVLLLEGTKGNGAALRALLEEAGCEAEAISPGRFPTSMASLSQYALIVMLDVDAQDMSAPQQRLLNEAVSKYGRSVLAAGGTHTFAFGHMKDTPVEKLLPVLPEPGAAQSGQGAAMVLLIDNSASMGENQTRLATASDSALNAAKKGAVLCLDQLRPNDRLAVISFSEHPQVVYPLASVDEREEMLNAISRMGTLDGTNFSSALWAALDAFSGLETARKYVTLISDGNPSDTGYEDAVIAMREQGVVLSTIGVGNAVNKEVLLRLAELGGGHFSHTESGTALPELMARDAALNQGDYLAAGPAAVTPAEASSRTALPPVDGYARLAARNGAQVLWQAGDDPLCALWAYGKGRAAAIAFDLSGEWSREWFRDEAGKAALLDVIQAILPPGGVSRAIDVELENTGSQSLLRVRDETGAVRRVSALLPGLDAETELIQVARGRFEAYVPVQAEGVYPMTLRLWEGTGETPLSIETSAAGSWPLEYEAFPGFSGEELLAGAARAAGGRLWTETPLLTSALLADVPLTVDPTPWLAALAAALLLAEILWRKRQKR